MATIAQCGGNRFSTRFIRIDIFREPAAAASTYGGVTALAVGANYWVSKQILINAHLTQGISYGARTGTPIGATIGF
ncbi:YadA-like family protein [Burkholderia pseudomallei]